MDEMTVERLQFPGEREELKVSGRVTISEAADFRAALLGPLETAGELQVDLGELTAMDLTGLQLLCAAHQSAMAAGKSFTVNDRGNGIFRKAAADAGFLRYTGCSRDKSCSCIWGGGQNNG